MFSAFQSEAILPHSFSPDNTLSALFPSPEKEKTFSGLSQVLFLRILSDFIGFSTWHASCKDKYITDTFYSILWNFSLQHVHIRMNP